MENEVKEVEEVEEKSSHHHHSHHHHHHHHKSSKKKRFSLRRFMQKHKTPIRIVTLLVVLVLVIAATVFTVKQLDAGSQGGTPTVDPPAPTTPQIPEGHVAVTVTRFDVPAVLNHDIVTTYLNTNLSIEPIEVLREYYQVLRLDQGQPVELAYDVLGLAEGCNITGFRVEVTEKGQKEPVFRKDYGAGESSVVLYNLKTASTYQYTVRADFNAMDSITVSGEFETAAGPRLLKVDGIANVRDFGGWKVGNTYIKQGLLYRGTELDGVIEDEFTIKNDGIKTMTELFGIRTEMDLRETETRPDRNMLGNEVNYPAPYNVPLYEAVFERSGQIAMCRIFQDLANPENYPIYTHCTYGRDRTGTVCLVLGAVLGMEEDDLIREYGLSALYYGNVDYADAYKVLDGMKAFGGETLREQTENYLLSIGLTADEIASLRQIYLG